MEENLVTYLHIYKVIWHIIYKFIKQQNTSKLISQRDSSFCSTNIVSVYRFYAESFRSNRKHSKTFKNIAAFDTRNTIMFVSSGRNSFKSVRSNTDSVFPRGRWVNEIPRAKLRLKFKLALLAVDLPASRIQRQRKGAATRRKINCRAATWPRVLRSYIFAIVSLHVSPARIYTRMLMHGNFAKNTLGTCTDVPA